MKLNATAKILGYKNKIKAGRYEIIGGSSSYGLLRQLVDGKVKMEWVTIPEGKQAKQIASILIARLLTTTSSKETAELIIGMAQIEEEAEKITEEKETKLH